MLSRSLPLRLIIFERAMKTMTRHGTNDSGIASHGSEFKQLRKGDLVYGPYRCHDDVW